MSVEAKVAQTAAKVVSQSGQQTGINPMQNGAESPFMSILQQSEIKMEAANADIMQTLGYDPSTHPADNAVSADNLQIEISAVEQMDSVQPTNQVANMLTELNRDGLQMEKVMELMTSGNNFSNRELIAVQALVHQAALEIQIGTQAMDAAKNSIQTLVQRSMN